MSDGHVGEEASQAFKRGDETPLESAGGAVGMDACNCERMEGGEVLKYDY